MLTSWWHFTSSKVKNAGEFFLVLDITICPADALQVGLVSSNWFAVFLVRGWANLKYQRGKVSSIPFSLVLSLTAERERCFLHSFVLQDFATPHKLESVFTWFTVFASEWACFLWQHEDYQRLFDEWIRRSSLGTPETGFWIVPISHFSSILSSFHSFSISPSTQPH